MKADYEAFGKAIFAWMEKKGGDIFNDEDSEELMEIAAKSGLARRVIYDPEKHGSAIMADPGDEIWWFGKEQNER